jgi:ubiquinone/menaquinone biosynthesis C-methylase UbiE
MSDNYDEYVYMQTVKYMSHEEDSVWADGQIRFLESITHLLPQNCKIFDAGCGDGVSLVKLNELGHTTMGIDLSEEKLQRAVAKGCSVVKADMHNLSFIPDNEFDVLISSHSLEHTYNPSLVLNEFNRILKSDGLLFIVLPFPDNADYAVEAHIGRDILGTSDPDNGPMVAKFIGSHGFNILTVKYDSYREPEIWISATKLQDQ